MADDEGPPDVGVPVLVEGRARAFGQVDGWVLLNVRHAELDREWMVLRTLDAWEHPGLELGECEQAAPVEVARYVLHVHGRFPASGGSGVTSS